MKALFDKTLKDYNTKINASNPADSWCSVEQGARYSLELEEDFKDFKRDALKSKSEELLLGRFAEYVDFLGYDTDTGKIN